MHRLVPVALVIALLLPAAALAGARYRCLYTGETSDHCKAAEPHAEASAGPCSEGPVVEPLCCEALASPFVAAPARIESGSHVAASVAALPAAAATQARPRTIVRSPAVVAREGPTSDQAPEFLLHCSLQL